MATNPVPTPSIPAVQPKPQPSVSPNLPAAPQNSTPTGVGANPTAAPKITPAGIPSTTITFNNLIPVYDQNTKSWTTAYVDSTGAEKWAAMYADPSSPTGYSISTDQVSVRTQTIKALITQYGTLSKAKTALAQQGLYKESGIGNSQALASVKSKTEDDAFDKVIDRSIGAISRTNLLNGGQNVTDLASYVNGRPNYAGTKNTVTVSETSKEAASVDIDAFMRKTVGRAATSAEFQDYYNNLHDYELKHPIRANVTRDALGTETERVQIEGPSQQDKTAILVGSVYKSILAAGKDPVAISKMGGDIAIAVQKLNQTAADYGVSGGYSGVYVFTQAQLAPTFGLPVTSGLQVQQLTANTALIANGSQQLASSTTTATELSYVHGVTSPIQAQINAITTEFYTRSINSVSTNTAAGFAANTDYIYLVTGTTSITLPSATSNTNRYTIKNVGIGVVTIVGTIDGSTNIALQPTEASVDLISNGTSWNII